MDVACHLQVGVINGCQVVESLELVVHAALVVGVTVRVVAGVEGAAVLAMGVVDIYVTLNESVLFHIDFAAATEGAALALEGVASGTVLEVLLL